MGIMCLKRCSKKYILERKDTKGLAKSPCYFSHTLTASLDNKIDVAKQERIKHMKDPIERTEKINKK